jgi:hypothetical protein
MSAVNFPGQNFRNFTEEPEGLFGYDLGALFAK